MTERQSSLLAKLDEIYGTSADQSRKRLDGSSARKATGVDFGRRKAATREIETVLGRSNGSEQYSSDLGPGYNLSTDGQVIYERRKVQVVAQNEGGTSRGGNGRKNGQVRPPRQRTSSSGR